MVQDDKQTHPRRGPNGRAMALWVVGSMTVSALALGLGAATASAAPANAPTSISGTFSCPGGHSGTFVVNSGNANGQSWNPAFLTNTSNGNTANFIPTALNLTFTGPGVSSQIDATKGNTIGEITCTVNAVLGPFTLSGTATGNIVHKG
jgi:hypothetical protein